MSRSPALASTRDELTRLLGQARGGARPVALVPTMGALHEGHASLIRLAKERAGEGEVVVSIFVNPMQFGPTEDLDRYPRTLATDLELCGDAGADVVFAPSVAEVYPGSDATMVAPRVTVDPGELAGALEGAVRPGHFRGVLTVVAKLLGLVRPDLVVFGEKDYQQLTLIRQMVTDLSLSVEVWGAETQREADGLALSSRNRFLEPAQRETASALSRALCAAQEHALTPADAVAAARRVLETEPGLDVDYLVVTDPGLGPLPDRPPPQTPGRVLVAAKIGTTRLIDNMPLVLGTS